MKSGGNFFVARDDLDGSEPIVGFVALKNKGSGHGEIKRFATVATHRGRGIGITLVGTAVGWAKDNGYTHLSLSTGPKERARGIYEDWGFRVYGQDQKFHHVDWLMELDLELEPIQYRRHRNNELI